MSISGPVRGPHNVALGLFALVWLSIVWFGSFEYNPNNATRLFAAISLVENHDATILHSLVRYFFCLPDVDYRGLRTNH